MGTTIKSTGRIVVGSDGSDRAYKAVEWAAERAAARGLPLTIVYVVPEVPLPGRTAAIVKIAEGANYLANVLDKAQRKLDQIVESVRAQYSDADIAGQVVQGNASYLLAEASKDAALVVVGARGAGAPISVRMLGGVSDAIVQHAHGPVAVIDDHAIENPEGPVVVGIDDSVESKAAIALAFDAANQRGVPLVALTAWEFGLYDPRIWDQSSDLISDDLVKMVKELIAESAVAHPDVKVEIKITDGSPESALVEASKTAGLVVVGSRGRGGFKGLLLGSTSKHVLREAHCPVIVVRG